MYLGFLRGWGEVKGNFSIRNDASNASLDPDRQFPGGSYLYKNVNAEIALAGAGMGISLGEAWEVASSFHQSIYGKNSANQMIATLGLAYRPKVPDEEKKIVEEPPFRIQQEKIAVTTPSREFLTYIFSTPILKISHRGNFYKIGRGSFDGVRLNDEFHIYSAKSPTQVEKLLATAEVIAVHKKESFLRLRELHLADADIKEGDEARRVIYEEAPGFNSSAKP